jgi:ABC-type phosphate transport system permease subunit
MSTTTTIFGDGILDIHIANGVARITLGAATGQKDAKPLPSGMLVVPVMQLPTFARVLGEVTRQVEQRAKEAMAQQAKPAEPTEADQVAGAFRFNG